MTRPKRILFDANPLVNGNKSGVGYYTHNLVQALANEYPDDLALVGHYFNFLGRRGEVQLPQAPNISYVQSKLIPGKVLSVTRRLGFQLPLEMFFKRRGDAALFTNFFSLPSLFSTPRIVAVHDLAFIDKPEFVAEKNRKFLQRYVPQSLKSAWLTITISEVTKQGIEKNYGVPAKYILVTPIPPGRKLITKQWPTAVPKDKAYILFVGTLEPRKNIINLVRAYEQLSESLREKYCLVLAGGEGWYMEETMAYIEQLQGHGYPIIVTGYVSDNERAALYEHASLFAMPSHYEGFGMPLLEAMDYDIPVVASDIPVFHEVASKAAHYFDKDDATNIRDVLTEALTDESSRKLLIRTGRERLQSYSWPAVARSVFEHLKQLS